ncbi:hypothetical protein BBJ28_00008352 [Nothophytophthora sp. Chile5]|nr:hypothetical protein BBJ28_00008352 [Nothophytophthora sp. Chile5]
MAAATNPHVAGSSSTESARYDTNGGDEASSFCDWEQFHLSTVGASTLHAAAWDGSFAILQFLLAEGQEVDERGSGGVTALMVTLLRHNVQAMRAVFQGSAVVQRNTIMDCRKEDAERLGHTLEVVKLLLHYGADTEARDQDGKTALHLTTNDELFEVARLMLERGARLDAQDVAGRSPLHLCLLDSAGQSVLVTNLLVAHGAPIDLPDTKDETPLDIVVCLGDVTALQLLLNHHALVATDTRRDFAGAVLLQAAELGVGKIVRFLLEGEYTSIDFANARGETALHLAIVKIHPPLIEQLCSSVSAAQLLRARTRVAGESVLHYAARYGSPAEMTSVLTLLGRENSQEVNAASASGLTPLYLTTTAATAGSPMERREKVALLEAHGATLFPRNARLFYGVQGNPNSVLVAVAAAVKRCLAQWLVECNASTLSDFCLKWAACVASSHRSDYPAIAAGGRQTRRGPSTSTPHQSPLCAMLPSVICAGYAVDSVPLLLVLPLEREATPRFVELLGALAAETDHPLLRRLQEELLAVWRREAHLNR